MLVAQNDLDLEKLWHGIESCLACNVRIGNVLAAIEWRNKWCSMHSPLCPGHNHARYASRYEFIVQDSYEICGEDVQYPDLEAKIDGETPPQLPNHDVCQLMH